jgi:hypothetical protein
VCHFFLVFFSSFAHTSAECVTSSFYFSLASHTSAECVSSSLYFSLASRTSAKCVSSSLYFSLASRTSAECVTTSLYFFYSWCVHASSSLTKSLSSAQARLCSTSTSILARDRKRKTMIWGARKTIYQVKTLGKQQKNGRTRNRTKKGSNCTRGLHRSCIREAHRTRKQYGGSVNRKGVKGCTLAEELSRVRKENQQYISTEKTAKSQHSERQ